jgi:hypothetical protein
MYMAIVVQSITKNTMIFISNGMGAWLPKLGTALAPAGAD